MRSIRVWDLPTRLFHGALVIGVLGLLVSGTVGGNWMVWHLRLGYAVGTLLLFRLLWGFVGGHWSRFASFWPTPSRLRAALSSRRDPAMPKPPGHSVWGACSVIAMLLILTAQVASGLISDDEIAFSGPLVQWVSSDWSSAATTYHKNIGRYALLALMGLHLLAIAYYALWRREPLVGAMVHGDREVVDPAHGPWPTSADHARQRMLALALLSAAAALMAWMVNAAG